eukprot:CAMPEP_0182807264 /NCGR_PEP_ID=MMETSP0006_2-20121128/6040_1 /TAXON_ID=97485 /ORGANISM="Prymnesium parvum, Strain Texoma1" /LENGTH=91 /DNA_ID=CAMNT_0024932935 /DNA_START=452 /DNA_END=727 /DNA_ORIENTATION=+
MPKSIPSIQEAINIPSVEVPLRPFCGWYASCDVRLPRNGGTGVDSHVRGDASGDSSTGGDAVLAETVCDDDVRADGITGGGAIEGIIFDLR